MELQTWCHLNLARNMYINAKDYFKSDRKQLVINFNIMAFIYTIIKG